MYVHIYTQTYTHIYSFFSSTLHSVKNIFNFTLQTLNKLWFWASLLPTLGLSLGNEKVGLGTRWGPFSIRTIFLMIIKQGLFMGNSRKIADSAILKIFLKYHIIIPLSDISKVSFLNYKLLQIKWINQIKYYVSINLLFKINFQ